MSDFRKPEHFIRTSALNQAIEFYKDEKIGASIDAKNKEKSILETAKKFEDYIREGYDE